ncbi:discoidin domain-containing protein, partial [Clostridium sp.]|uniref:discoidin domain-containing protein n=1 Tax=Clostridium sp. TaxID=1506 RepID=UPI003F2CE772
RRDFTLDKSYEGKKVFVEFEGAMGNTEVFINGKNITKHYGGYLPFTVDISEFINFEGNNVIAVKLDNSNDPQTPPGKPQNVLDFLYYGGLYRNVNLYLTDKVYVTDSILADKVGDGGVFVTYPEVSKENAVVNVTTNVKNDYAEDKKAYVTTEIINKSGEVVASNTSEKANILKGTDNTFKQVIEVINPDLWTTYDPNLYTLKTLVKINDEIIDTVETKIGIRRIEFTNDRGFFINDEHIFLNGVNRHQEYLYIGNAAPDSLQYDDAKQIKDAGFNMVRTGHYPPAKSFLDACDELGIVVIEPIPGWQTFGDSVFQERAIQAVREMVRRDRNHPSLVLWESSLNETWMSREFAQAAYDATHEEYPGDQCYAASDYTSYGKEIYDVNYKEIDTSDKPLLTREWGDEWSEKADSPEGYRSVRSVGELDMINSCYSRQNALNGNGYFDWCGLNANKRISGYALWSYNDYNRGTENETAFSGIVDRDRYEKFNYYYLQSQRNPELIQDGVDSGPMVFIANYWMESSPKDVNVFSNCEQVKLYLNDELIEIRNPDEGFEHIAHPTFTFKNVPWKAGNLKAEGIINGEVVAEYEVNTPGEPHHVEIDFTNAERDLLADGSDVIIGYASVRDENGNIVSNYSDLISLNVYGEGKLIGNAEERSNANPVKVEGGIAPVFIQSTNTAGDINIVATADGVENGNVVIKTKPVNENFVPGGSDVDESAIYGKNIGLNKEVLCSSELEGFEASKVNDGDKNSLWKPLEGENQWITIDLGENRNILGLKLDWKTTNKSKNYTIQVSKDNENWISLYKGTDNKFNDKELFKFASYGRYIRVLMEGNSKDFSELSELTVYGNEEGGGDLVEDEKRVNVALGKEAFASSNIEGREPNKAIDADTSSMWRAETDGVEWITVDLCKLYNITGSKILWGKDSVYYSYKIEVSDDNKNWKEVLKSIASGQNMLPDNYSENWVRYVRITIDKLNGGVLEVPAIRELEVYGKDIAGVEKIPQNQMSVVTNSEETIDRDNKALNTIDGIKDTMWHSQWTPTSENLPQDIVLSLDKSYKISKLNYLPRQDGSTNGRILKYNVYVSEDGKNFTKIEEEGVWANNKEEKQTNFEAINASYIKLECIDGLGDYATASEINIYELDSNGEEKKIPQNLIKAKASSEELVGGNNGASNVLDGDPNTIWHTNWTSAGLPQKPYYLIYDLGGTYNVEEFRYLPRQDSNSNGDIYKYNLYTSEDGENFKLVKENGTLAKDKTEKTIKFNQTKARFVKFEVLDSYGGHASAAEINIYKALVDGINIDTTVGVKPNLPNEVRVTLDSENIRTGIAIWEEIDESLYEKEGEFTVSGVIKDIDIKITANVKVVKEEVDKEPLKIVIDEVNDLLNNSLEGFNEGNYHIGSKNELNKSLEVAKRIYEDKDATKIHIEKAIEDLNNAIGRFESLLIGSLTGDLNKNGRFDIGDLSIVSKLHGINESSSSDQWNKAKEFDLNKDGFINDYELEFVTFKILN